MRKSNDYRSGREVPEKPEVLGIGRSQLGHTGKEGHQWSYGAERNQPTNGVQRQLSLGTDRRSFRMGRNWLTLGERKKGSRRKGVLKAYGFFVQILCPEPLLNSFIDFWSFLKSVCLLSFTSGHLLFLSCILLF